MEVLGRQTSLTSVDFVIDLDSLHGIAYTDMSPRVIRKDMQVEQHHARFAKAGCDRCCVNANTELVCVSIW